MKVIRTDILDFNQVWTIEFIKLSAAEISNSHLYIYPYDFYSCVR